MIPPVGISQFAAIGATIAVLWLSPATAGEAGAEALRLQIDGQVADAWFGVEPLREVVRIYVTRRPPPPLSYAADFRAGSTDLFFVFEAEHKLRAVQLDLLKHRVEQQMNTPRWNVRREVRHETIF